MAACDLGRRGLRPYRLFAGRRHGTHEEFFFMAEPGRKKPEQNVHISPSSANIVFLTVCTKNRERWLAQAAVRHALESVWKNAHSWIVGRYVLMPDHLHLFCAPYDLEIPLQTWVTYWKRQFSRLQIPETGAWQRLSWHHRLRSDENYDEKWDYVRNNPIRAGLCEKPDDWPYQGEPNTLRW